MTRVRVGTYKAKGGPGLAPIVRDDPGREWRVETPLAHVRNASFAIAGSTEQFRYAVDEEANVLIVYRGPDWEEIARIPSRGDDPCHLALFDDGRRLAGANYASGTVAVFAIGDEGDLRAVEMSRHEGYGPNPERQDGPHAHWVGFAENGALISVDLGADRIFAHAPGGVHTRYAAPPGSGPRHLAFHPNLPIAYLVSELASTLTVLRTEGATWRAEAIISTLPSGWTGESLGGAIVVDQHASRLHVTNRGHDSVATFALDPDGAPRLLRHLPSGGASPRFVLLVGDQLLVAHEEGGGVAAFAIGDDGAPAGPPQVLDVAGAAFLMIHGD